MIASWESSKQDHIRTKTRGGHLPFMTDDDFDYYIAHCFFAIGSREWEGNYLVTRVYTVWAGRASHGLGFHN